MIAWAGRHQRSAWEELSSDYRQRISRWMPIRDLAVRARAAPEDPQRLRLEGEAILAALPADAWLIALDRTGVRVSSEELAAELTRLRCEWPHAIAFAIGSDLGLDRAVVDKARKILSFGAMTFGHELARLLLYEQLYRALSIEAGMSYHREPLRG